MLNSSIRAQYVLQCEDIISIMQLFLCLQRWQRDTVGVKPFSPLDHLPNRHTNNIYYFSNTRMQKSYVYGWERERERVCALERERERERMMFIWKGREYIETKMEAIEEFDSKKKQKYKQTEVHI